MDKDSIREVICAELGIEALSHQDIAYEQNPQWTSSSHINVIMALEERLGCEFDGDEIVEMTDIDRIFGIIAAKRLSEEGQA